ncbi:unnamed protein product [Linum trigynum]|uniref:Uncharacterized protein n=1 Tax=Linum trigynum TaxID=586398 RepID=A0AAV2FXK7_9ROSI
MLNVFYVLMRHRACLNNFSLLISDLRSAFPDHRIGQIIGSLTDRRFESLSIDIKDHVLPRCIFSLARLKNLKLCGCQFRSSNVAFDCAELDVFELRGLAVPKIGGGEEARFSFNRPSLSALTMVGCDDFYDKISIVIEAPKLEYFRDAGSSSLLEFKHTPLLKIVHVHQDISFFEDKGYFNMSRFTNGLPAVEQLSLSGYFYNIGKQHISAAVDDCDPKLINDNKSSWPKLNRMKMEQFEATKLDMAFVRSLLAASPALDKMEIEFSARHGLQDRW